jgi:CHAT domain-containing protein
MEGSSPVVSLAPSYEALQIRGQILVELGRTDEALVSLRNAVRRADEWRSAALPGDVSSTATVALLHSVYSDYTNFAAATALARHDEALVRDSLEVMARSRAANLREEVAAYLQQLDRFPPEYYSLLRQLDAAQARTLADPGGSDELAAQQIRAQLSLLQDRVGIKVSEFSKDRERNFYQKSLRDIQQSLGAEDLLLSFSLGKKMADTSYMWATTADSVSLYSIGTRRAIEAAADQFKTAVRSRDNADAPGCRLSEMLFSKLPTRLQARQHWLLVPDGGLLDGVPWAALPQAGNGTSTSLIARRDVRTLPGEIFLSAKKQTINRTFVGVGDPIYNQADARLAVGQKRTSKPVRPLRLSRLAGSQTEVENASRAWKPRSTVLLTAEHATLDELKSAIEHQSPGVLHFGVHVLSPDNHPEQAALALSLTPKGFPELLTPEIISTFRVPGSIVVLSGCASQRGKVVPGAGVIGLSRAWLLAGASAVIVSAWPTPDDSGRFFEVFYSSLERHDPSVHSVVERAASALRAAQLEMQHESSFRRSPDYWVAYSVISKE